MLESNSVLTVQEASMRVLLTTWTVDKKAGEKVCSTLFLA